MTNLSEEILNLLGNNLGKSLACDDLTNRLQISRSILLKQIQALQKRGHGIETDGSQRFSLKPLIDGMAPKDIQGHLKTNFIGQDLHYFPEVDSSFEKAFLLAQKYPETEEPMTPLRPARPKNMTKEDPTSFAGNGSVIVSEISPQDSSLWPTDLVGINLHSSVVLRPGILPTRAPQIALVSLVALARVIESMSGIRSAIEWPNRLSASHKDIAKIKVTMQSNVDKINFLILGFEVNLNGLTDSLDESMVQNVTSIRSVCGKSLNRSLFAANLFRELEKWYITYINKGSEKIVREAGQFFPYTNKEILVISKGKKHSGIAEGLDSDGSLILRMASGPSRRIPAADLIIEF